MGRWPVPRWAVVAAGLTVAAALLHAAGPLRGLAARPGGATPAAPRPVHPQPAAGTLRLQSGGGPQRGRGAARGPRAPGAVLDQRLPRLAPGAMVRVILRYPACGVQRSGRGPLPVGLVGLDRRQVAREMGPDTIVARLRPRELVLERELPGCPDAWATLRDDGGRVTVFAGRPGDLGPVLQRTDIPVRALAPANRRRLERGLVVRTGQWRAAVEALRQDLR